MRIGDRGDDNIAFDAAPIACAAADRPRLCSPLGVVRQNPQFVRILQLTAAGGVREHA
jgi:hypothetical protein